MCELEQPLILVVADKIKSVSQIVPVLDLVKKSGTKRPLLLVSEDLQEDPMSTMIYNKQKGIIDSCAINVPWLGGVHKEMLKDIAVMTGATLVDNEMDLKLEDIQISHFGSAKNIRVDHEYTHIVGGSFDAQKLEDRIEQIK